tara:strand:- start:519 stop:944 length:426 start_codon:yes stop_codon:yes gene_type:complete
MISSLIAGSVTTFGAYRVVSWIVYPRELHTKSEQDIEAAKKYDTWKKHFDIEQSLVIIKDFCERNKEDKVIDAIYDQQKYVQKLYNELENIVGWRNENYYVRYFYYTGEGTKFKLLKQEYAILKSRVDLIQQLRMFSYIKQ